VSTRVQPPQGGECTNCLLERAVMAGRSLVKKIVTYDPDVVL